MKARQRGEAHESVTVPAHGNSERTRGTKEPGIKGSRAIKVAGRLPGPVASVVGPLDAELEAVARGQTLSDNEVHSVLGTSTCGERPGIVSRVSTCQARARHVTNAATEREADMDVCGLVAEAGADREAGKNEEGKT